MDYTKPTHEEIKAHAQALYDWLQSTSKPYLSNELPRHLQGIIDSKPTEADKLYAELKRLHLENERLKKEAKRTEGIRQIDALREPQRPKGWTWPFEPAPHHRQIWFGIYPPNPIEIPDQSIDPNATLKPAGGYHQSGVSNMEAANAE